MCLFAQSEQLAQNYLDQGEYQKALSTYEVLLKDNPANINYFYGLVTCYQQLENFVKADELLLERLKESNNNPSLYIELGHNAELQLNEEMAKSYYSKALDVLRIKPNYTYSVARNFEKYSLLENAETAYIIGMSTKNSSNYNLPLARIYGERGELEKMFTAYLDLLDKDPEKVNNLIREFEKYIQEDPSHQANQILRKLLLKKQQQSPSISYNQLLSWLFVQQHEFKKAFLQEKALYRRDGENLQRIIQLLVVAKSASDLSSAQEIVGFVIEETSSPVILVQANQLLLDMKVSTAKVSDYKEIEEDFKRLLGLYGKGVETIALQIDYANFLAFKTDKIQEAISLLKELSTIVTLNYELSAVKMALADILVLDQKFNEALIYYSQIQQLVKNDELSQQARFKVAKTSYYKGDFSWAKTQLDVLKASSTQLIANDAMELSLLISENTLQDSTQSALKRYAHAEFLSFQNKNTEAIAALEELLQLHKGERIEDEALLKQAILYEKESEWDKAEANYIKIIEFYKTDILGDNATYRLAELYKDKLQQPEKAKDFYEEIIFNYADSIYFVDATKKYRVLRGDTLE
ncbi:tetratricopeptide repeat protein [Gillisia sp. M10.2A]|uniref:Tetratricopeptide repeat protein n=1 Tax=Gillisia lutea TaxID=2909668 RepID=A0ABS9EDV0_9FLAO|nr:tetratricopeptide repeat protein [Gillisia lutea]MCF4100359.1 tetratricopeptide repeat protein [Gillisia lutea]